VSWEAPPGLWLGLTIPAIVALWILRPRRPRVRVPSLLLWPASPVVRQSARPWQRLRNHPLLWIQIIAAALLAIAAARPFLAGAGDDRDVVVFLDASGSMRAVDVTPDRFTEAKRLVVDLARGLGPSERLTVVRVDGDPRILVAGARGDGQVEAALRNEAAGYAPGDMRNATALATSFVRQGAEWVLVGDGGMGIPDDVRVPANTTLRHIPVGRVGDNVAITGLSLREIAPGALAVQAALKSTGARPITGRLQILAEGELVGARDWSIEPGGESYVTWTGLSSGPAWFEARLTGVTVERNVLPHDDQAWVASPRTGDASVLLVSDGNLFLERALTLDQRLSAFRAAPADWSDLAGQRQSAITVFDGIWPEPEPAGSALYVRPAAGSQFTPGQMRPSADHPLLRFVDWSDVHVAAARNPGLDGTWETVIDSDGGPILAVRTVGSRREAVLTFPLTQSDLPLRPAYPILMANLLEWLLPALDSSPQSVLLGSPLSLEVSPLTEQVSVELPDGSREELAPPWPPRPLHVAVPGVYHLVQSNSGGTQTRVFTSDGYHPLEGDPTPRQPSAAGTDDRSGPPSQPDRPLWPLVAAAILALSLVEWWVDGRGR
jgi:hypothetical protein